MPRAELEPGEEARVPGGVDLALASLPPPDAGGPACGGRPGAAAADIIASAAGDAFGAGGVKLIFYDFSLKHRSRNPYKGL